MVSKIILTLLIGLVTCGQSDINIQAQQQEFHACQLVCENKGINVKSQCIYTLAIRTTELLYQAEVRCNRVIEGLVNQCIRSQCVQSKNNYYFINSLPSQKIKAQFQLKSWKNRKRLYFQLQGQVEQSLLKDFLAAR